MTVNLKDNNFEQMFEEDEDENLMRTAYEKVAYAMEGEEIDLATAMMVVLRDYIGDYYEDETMGFRIATQVAKGNE
jgi:glutathionylspermidine synthase